ncbi:FAD:protein FMN transferase [subsurface metagenome]
MRKKLFVWSFILIAVFGFVFLSYKRNAYIVLDGFTQGTSYHIIYKNKFSPFSLINKNKYYYKSEVDALLAEIDLSLSIYQPGSIISGINRNDTTVRTDDHFKKVFRRAKEISEKTNGVFDITVGPVVNAWGFGPERKADIDSALIDSLLQFIGMDKVELEGDKVIKQKPGIKLDVNAIAQGYTVDVISGFFENKEIFNYLVEIGGEVKTRGTKAKGESWKIGVDKPYDYNFIPGRDLQVILSLSNRSLATSGNYRKFIEEDGIKYSHSINPKTGYPVRNNLLSVTVVAEDCMTADAYATAFMVMGLEESRKIVLTEKDLEIYFIYSDEKGEFQTYHTLGFDRLIEEEL